MLDYFHHLTGHYLRLDFLQLSSGAIVRSWQSSLGRELYAILAFRNLGSTWIRCTRPALTTELATRHRWRLALTAAVWAAHRPVGMAPCCAD